MKKNASLFIVIVLCICNTFALCGCGWFDYSSESEVATKKLEQLIDCLDRNDHNGVKALFSSKHIANIDNFDDDVDELLSLYSGKFVSHNFDIPATYESTDYGKRKRWFIISADITTTEGVFFLAMYWCDREDSDRSNEGIWSLYMFNKKDNPLDDYSFYGDSSWGSEDINGIYVVKPYKYIEMTMNIIRSGDAEAVKMLFAPSIISGNVSLDEDIDSLFSYYSKECAECAETASDIIVQTDSYGKTIRRFRLFSYTIDTADGIYLLALKYCDMDAEVSDNVGMHSIYIKKAIPADTAYWGDGLWVDGVIIDE